MQFFQLTLNSVLFLGYEFNCLQDLLLLEITLYQLIAQILILFLYFINGFSIFFINIELLFYLSVFELDEFS